MSLVPQHQQLDAQPVGLALTEAAEALGIAESVLVRLSQFFQVPAAYYAAGGRFHFFKGDLRFGETDLAFLYAVQQQIVAGASLEEIRRAHPALITASTQPALPLQPDFSGGITDSIGVEASARQSFERYKSHNQTSAATPVFQKLLQGLIKTTPQPPQTLPVTPPVQPHRSAKPTPASPSELPEPPLGSRENALPEVTRQSPRVSPPALSIEEEAVAAHNPLGSLFTSPLSFHDPLSVRDIVLSQKGPLKPTHKQWKPQELRQEQLGRRRAEKIIEPQLAATKPTVPLGVGRWNGEMTQAIFGMPLNKAPRQNEAAKEALQRAATKLRTESAKQHSF